MALMRLGPDFRFQTRVTAESLPDARGRIHGPLRLIGGGDPNLSARAIPYRMGPVTGNPLAAIEDLADQIAARGVKRVSGGITGDDTWYVWEPYASGWGIEDPESDDGPPISALTVSDNALTLRCNRARGRVTRRRSRFTRRSNSTGSTTASAPARPAPRGASASTACRTAWTYGCGARFPCGIGRRTWFWASPIRPATPRWRCGGLSKSAASRSKAKPRRCTVFRAKFRI